MDYILANLSLAFPQASALPLLQRNIDSNKHLHSKTNVIVDCIPLDWSDESDLTNVQIVIVSDCTYNPTYFKPLCSTIHSLLKAGDQAAFCLLAKKHRHMDEEALWSEMGQQSIAPALLRGNQSVEEGDWGLWKLTLK
jgi:predicted nicotinamide N-methyase